MTHLTRTIILVWATSLVLPGCKRAQNDNAATPQPGSPSRDVHVHADGSTHADHGDDLRKQADELGCKGFTDYRARVMVKKDSPLRSMQDLKDRKIGVPSVDSITTVMFSASLREMKIQYPEKQFLPMKWDWGKPSKLDWY